MSDGLGYSTILGCLESGEVVMDVPPCKWYSPRAGNLDLELFCERQYGWRDGLKHLGESLRSYADLDPAKIVEKMRQWKMQVQTPPIFPPGSVYMISQFKEKLDWAVPGTRINKFAWPAFWLKGMVKFYRHGLSDQPVVKVYTRNGDEVFMTRWTPELHGMEFLRQIEKIEQSMVPMSSDEYDGVQVPCVNAEMHPDLNWIIGMTNGGYFVAWAKQLIKFGMNEIGFAVREETAMVTMKGFVYKPEPYVISPFGESFLFWRRRQGIEFPISMYQFDRFAFQDPGDLQGIVD